LAVEMGRQIVDSGSLGFFGGLANGFGHEFRLA
jgi:hypothetical protein